MGFHTGISNSGTMATEVLSISHTSFLRNVTTTDAGFQAEPAARLREELLNALIRLDRRLDRSGLSDDIRAEIRTALSVMRSRYEPASPAAPGFSRASLNAAIRELTGLHDHLCTIGFSDEPVTLRLAVEARGLERALGGAVGSGGGSDSAS
ncbi:hypothetical protein [Streptomyces sp. NBC_00454]|uniref:hypothetical protein n=1 Tax=Streptomyces sp. NBC_00454 TaxID=2975747 RepID=UPI0030E5D558